MAAVTRVGLAGFNAAYGTFGDKALGTATGNRSMQDRGRARKRLWWLILIPLFYRVFSA